jgi:predicted enzyme related to lactoylglutathione lyase
METGRIVWFEFPVREGKRSMEFYKKVFDWKFQAANENYWMINVGKDVVGALRLEPASGFVTAQGGGTFYFTVPSVKEAKTLVTNAGGELLGKATDLGGNRGHVQMFADLDGNTLALWSKNP